MELKKIIFPIVKISNITLLHIGGYLTSQIVIKLLKYRNEIIIGFYFQRFSV